MKEKIILAAIVERDGGGDLTHLLEIYAALKDNPNTSKYEYIAVIYCGHPSHTDMPQKIEQKLKAMNIPYYLFLTEDDLDELPKALQVDLKECQQVLAISSQNILTRLEDFRKQSLLNLTTPIKFLGEHEHSARTFHFVESFSMGLKSGDEFSGIKIKDLQQLTEPQAYSVIENNDPHFITTLLKYSYSENLETFREKNDLIPAYFQHTNINQFFKFLQLCAINHTFSSKDIAVYLSTGNIELFKLYLSLHLQEQFTFAAKDVPAFEASDIKQIEFITKEGAIQIYPPQSAIAITADGNEREVSWNGKEIMPKTQGRTIRIFCDEYLSKPSYEALYQIAPIAAVTGDNTFELAISSGTFPYYISTNFNNEKYKTLVGLSGIIQRLEAIPAKVKEDYMKYFNYRTFKVFANNGDIGLDDNSFANLDFAAMKFWWPLVIDHIKEHHNYYNNLEAILFKGLASELVSEIINKNNEITNESLRTNLGDTGHSSNQPDDQLVNTLTKLNLGSIENQSAVIIKAIENEIARSNKPQTMVDLERKNDLLKKVENYLNLTQNKSHPNIDLYDATARLRADITILDSELAQKKPHIHSAQDTVKNNHPEEPSSKLRHRS